MKPQGRESSSSSFWIGGVNSLLHPADIAKNQIAWAENIIHRGGIIQNRPGHAIKSSIEGEKLQGFCMFTPRGSDAKLIAAVDGVIYAASWPELVFRPIGGSDFRFSESVEMVHFQPCVQSSKRNQDGSITLIDPTPILMISDGESLTGYWDGLTAKKLRGDTVTRGTPILSWMKWSGSCLWGALGNRVYVSDLTNPLSFFDNQYLAQRSNFDLPGDVTGMIETSDQRSLLVFTKTTTTSFQSHVRDRAQWKAIPDFQRLVLPEIGCVAGRTAVNQYGFTYWMSESGVMSLDAASFALHSAKLDPVDGPMMRSKRNLCPEMGGACATARDNMLLMSVPSGSRYNAHTWVLDQSPLGGLPGSTPSWAGIWTGVCPVQYTQGEIGGRDRIYFASRDHSILNGTRLHIWESFLNSREDNGNPVSCQVQFAALAANTLNAFKYAEFELVEVLGEVDLSVYVIGTRGKRHLAGQFHYSAQKGSIGSPSQLRINATSILKAYRPQARSDRTEEFTPQDTDDTPELSGNIPGRDRGIALIFEWIGRMGIREITTTLERATAPNRGGVTGSEAGQVNMVTERGEVVPNE